MAEPPNKKPGKAAGKKYPSRNNVKYAGIPPAYWDALEKLAKDESSPFFKRSVAFMVTQATKEFLGKHNSLPAKDPPPEA